MVLLLVKLVKKKQELEKLKQEQIAEDKKIQEHNRLLLKKLGIQLVGRNYTEPKHSRMQRMTKSIPSQKTLTANITPTKTNIKKNLIDYSERKIKRAITPIRTIGHAESIQMNIANIIKEIYTQNEQLAKELHRIRTASIYKSHRRSYYPHYFNEFEGKINDIESVGSESTNEDIKSTSVFIPIKH